jgi:hypothetical protein
VCRGRHSRASTGRHTGRDRNDSCTTMPATTQQLGEPDRFRAFRRPVVMPGHPEYLLAGTPEQGVVNSEGQRGSGREQSGHDQIGQSQSHRIARPAGVREQSVRAAVMPHLIQAGTGEHSTHRSTASLSDQANNQPDESMECWSGKARPEHGKETGQRARCGGAGTHRRITPARVMKEPSMLSSSPSKIHEPRVTGVLPPPTAPRPAPAKLRNTSEPVGAENRVTASDQRLRRPPTSRSDLHGPGGPPVDG